MPFMPDSFFDILSPTGFPARWEFGVGWKQEPWWGWLHICSDICIAIAYFAIPIILIALSRSRRDLPFPKTIFLFASFILACGTTHLMDAIIFYWPAYRLAGVLKLITAAVSTATVFSLFYVMPKALLLRGPKEAALEIERQTEELRVLTRQLTDQIEARRIVAEELRESREMLQLAMAAGDIGSFSWNLRTDKVILDPAEMKLTGLQSRDGTIDSETYFACIDFEYRERVRANVQNALDGSGTYDVRFPFIRPDQTRVWLSGKGCVLRGSDGTPQTLIGINQDVTSQVKKEEILSETANEARSASEQKSRFIALVSHEIRTPLAAMLGSIDSLLLGQTDADTRESLRIVRSQGELLQVLVNDVLDLSKIEAGKLEFHAGPTVIANVFADVCSLMEPLAHEKGLQIHLIVESNLPELIQCDGYRLKQVFINLLGNAIKYTEHGSITIVVKLAIKQEVEADLVVEVRDTGCGIPRDKLQIVFQEYEQASSENAGTGLGLAICKRLVEMMGGTISVRSEVGLGSAFAVHIPLGLLADYHLVPMDQITKSMDRSEPTEVPIEKYPLRVLAAEDTRAIQFVLRRMIGQLVDFVEIVSNGQEAVERVMEAQASDTPFDLVLMDIQMPKLNGIEATRQMRREGFKAPIVALTAGVMESERDACMTAGCTFFLAKPIDLHEFRRILADVARASKA